MHQLLKAAPQSESTFHMVDQAVGRGRNYCGLQHTRRSSNSIQLAGSVTSLLSQLACPFEQGMRVNVVAAEPCKRALAQPKSSAIRATEVDARSGAKIWMTQAACGTLSAGRLVSFSGQFVPLLGPFAKLDTGKGSKAHPEIRAF